MNVLRTILILFMFCISTRARGTESVFTQYVSFKQHTSCDFSINSYIRSRAKNTSVGGSEGSFHLTGQALDISPLRGCNKSLKQLGKEATKYFNGVIVYRTHIHIDMGNRVYHKL